MATALRTFSPGRSPMTRLYVWFMRREFSIGLLRTHFRSEVTEYLGTSEVFLSEEGARRSGVRRPGRSHRRPSRCYERCLD